MFTYLSTHKGPVVEGLQEFERVYAENQSEYLTLRTLPGENGLSAISRWRPSDAQRELIAAGADILLEVTHFKKPLQPVRMMITDEKGEFFQQWFAIQTRAPYLLDLHEQSQANVTPDLPQEIEATAAPVEGLNPVKEGQRDSCEKP